jgi:hypothetical protein
MLVTAGESKTTAGVISTCYATDGRKVEPGYLQMRAFEQATRITGCSVDKVSVDIAATVDGFYSAVDVTTQAGPDGW